MGWLASRGFERSVTAPLFFLISDCHPRRTEPPAEKIPPPNLDAMLCSRMHPLKVMTPSVICTGGVGGMNSSMWERHAHHTGESNSWLLVTDYAMHVASLARQVAAAVS